MGEVPVVIWTRVDGVKVPHTFTIERLATVLADIAEKHGGPEPLTPVRLPACLGAGVALEQNIPGRPPFKPEQNVPDRPVPSAAVQCAAQTQFATSFVAPAPVQWDEGAQCLQVATPRELPVTEEMRDIGADVFARHECSSGPTNVVDGAVAISYAIAAVASTWNSKQTAKDALRQLLGDMQTVTDDRDSWASKCGEATERALRAERRLEEAQRDYEECRQLRYDALFQRDERDQKIFALQDQLEKAESRLKRPAERDHWETEAKRLVNGPFVKLPPGDVAQFWLDGERRNHGTQFNDFAHARLTELIRTARLHGRQSVDADLSAKIERVGERDASLVRATGRR